MTKEEIKLRRLINQHLLAPVSAETVLTDLCGLQAQFFGNALHALKIRSMFTPKNTNGMMKNWTLRSTMHIFSERDLTLFLRCGDQYRCNDWTEKSFWNQRDDWALSPERQKELSAVIMQALAEKDCTREELKQRCRERGMTELEENSMFHPWGGGIRQLCERGFLHYAAREEKVFCLSPVVSPFPQEKAELELARRYFTCYGPATIRDAMYFFKATATQVKKWLAQLPVKAVSCDGKNYYYLENEKMLAGEIPDCLYLAGFDPLMLGYEKKESLYLRQEDLRGIFTLAGIVMPPLLLNGEVAGRWKEKNGNLAITAFRSLTGGEVSLLKDKAEFLWPDLKKVEITE